jgi:hypothetical protein
MNDEQAGHILDEVLNLAVVVRDEGPQAVAHAAREVLAAAGGDPIAALCVASALIRVDELVDAWWVDPQPLPPAQDEAPTRPTVSLVKGSRGHSRPLKPCGSHAAYNRHVSRGEEIDDACGIAQRKYDRDRYVRTHGHRAKASGRAA